MKEKTKRKIKPLTIKVRKETPPKFPPTSTILSIKKDIDGQVEEALDYSSHRPIPPISK